MAVRGDEGGMEAYLGGAHPDVLAELPPICRDTGRKPGVPYPSSGGHGGGPSPGLADELGPDLKRKQVSAGAQAVDVGHEGGLMTRDVDTFSSELAPNNFSDRFTGKKALLCRAFFRRYARPVIIAGCLRLQG